jgi:hypothetical protein
LSDYAKKARKAQQQHDQKHDVQLELPDRTVCPVCGQADNCGDCNHYGTPHYVPDEQAEKEEWENLLIQSLGTCQSCGNYSSSERCPCGGEVL